MILYLLTNKNLKMKKISLKDFKKGLGRDEMKEISGGKYATYFACHSASFNASSGSRCVWYGNGWIVSHP